ncbi:MAG: tetratricopeptide repeat protein [Acidobacteriota bacterium]|nr:tetratricopeptide repeat protein [Acidobacteriota bacterium]MDQ7086822.1 tetratricopeptide repeat protein [Acidobacteriota bacterium]
MRAGWMTTCRPALLLAAALLVGWGCASGGARIAEKQKKGPLHFFRLAQLFYEQGKVDEALEQLARSLALDDSLPRTWFFRGQIYSAEDRCSQAVADFRRALTINPHYTEARMYLADCLERLGHPDEALAVLGDALRDGRFPYPEKIHYNRAMIYLRSGRLDDALAALRLAVEAQPRYYRAHFEMAKILEELSRLGEALEAYRTAAPGFSKDPEFLLARGGALLRAGRVDEAGPMLRRVVALSPGSPAAEQASRLLELID